MSTASTLIVERFDDADTAVAAATARFVDVVGSAIAERGSASVVLTGGGNGIALLRALRTADLAWDRIDVYWGDERYLPAGDPERNEVQARAALLDHVPVDPARVHPMATSDGPFGDDIEAAARDYAALLDPMPEFDVHLLGMGGEGHINSLFPHTAATAETERTVVAVTDSPKPPPRRVTLTLPAVAAAKRVWLVVSGEGKAEAVAGGVGGADPADWPCAGAHGSIETVWFVDPGAASLLD